LGRKALNYVSDEWTRMTAGSYLRWRATNRRRFRRRCSSWRTWTLAVRRPTASGCPLQSCNIDTTDGSSIKTERLTIPRRHTSSQ